MLKIIIADDHPLFRKGLRYVIQAVSDFEIVGEASDGNTVLRMVDDLHPDLLILDLEMPKKDGLDVARAIRELKIPVEIIFLTMHKEERLIEHMTELDVKGYLLKDNATEDLLECIDAVTRGEYYMSPFLSTHLLRAKQKSGNGPAIDTLTQAERSILKLIGEHKTSREIGDVLHISEKTVEKHRSNIARKLDLHGNHALLKFATEHKLNL